MNLETTRKVSGISAVPATYVSAEAKPLWIAWSGPPEYDNVSFIHGELQLK